ncbi:MAG TPA: sulfatase-like hydrolase/transferase [Verrucomicrobiales bacterium]|nr:sulfatase-like hydrolase/transferase [Verrucomicrobiales bacterium]
MNGEGACRRIWLILGLAALLPWGPGPAGAAGQTEPAPGASPSPDVGPPHPLDLVPIEGLPQRNIILIIGDRHRQDALSGSGHPWLETPHLDRLAQRGARFTHAFSTAPDPAATNRTLLTGLYLHRHKAGERDGPTPVLFPRFLRHLGYETAFVGCWKVADPADPPADAFDHRVVFRDDAATYAPGKGRFRVDGKETRRRSYLADEIADYAVRWLTNRKGARPFFLMVAHGGEGPPWRPAGRHIEQYTGRAPPLTIPSPQEDLEAPLWMRNRRNSAGGIEFPFPGPADAAETYRAYAETLLAVDDSVGRLMQFLREKEWEASTLVLYTSDGGYLFGEHGLAGSRALCDGACRVPLLLQCPGFIPEGRMVQALAADVDLLPTLLEAAGRRPPDGLDGKSLLPLAEGKEVEWRDGVLLAYFWDPEFPQTPTLHGLRTQRYRYARPYGVWDLEELYDLESDPSETRNLALNPAHASLLVSLRENLRAALEETEGLTLQIPVPAAQPRVERKADGSGPASFPAQWLEESPPKAQK